MRRLIFCFDGSWNRLDTKSHPTNVVLLAESIAPIDRHGVQQIVYYDEGVGTSSDETFRGGAFGKGLVQNIREAYRFLIFNHQPDDQIFVFGFSRGAFTARSFIGFIRLAGILRVNDAQQIDEAWSLYRKYADRADEDIDEVLKFRAAYCPGTCITAGELDWRQTHGHLTGGQKPPILRIRYCGVWDTVGTLGWKAVTAAVDRGTDKRYSKHAVELSATVEAGRHALALDERRVHFMPTLWRNVRALNDQAGASSYNDDAPFQQKWFAGDHGSVGGGGPERGLSNAALHWVLNGAVKQGLAVNLGDRSQLRDIRYNASAPLQNTPSEGIRKNRIGVDGAKAAIGWLKRTLLTATRSGPSEIADVHPSALRRWFTSSEELPELKDYRPATMLKLSDDVEELRNVYVPEVPDSGEFGTYQVKAGDTLSGIAQRELHGVSRAAEIFAINRLIIDDPDDIFVGDTLRMPPVSMATSPNDNETAGPDEIEGAVG